MIKIPKSECKYGYPKSQLEEILGSKLKEFNKYMVGQTAMRCDGKKYDRELDEYIPSGCGPHGLVIYECDLITFLEGKPTLD